MSDRFEPLPVPKGDGRHDIGDDARAAIVNRLTAEWSRDPELPAEKVRQLAMWAGASVRALLHELGTLRDLAEPTPARVSDARLADARPTIQDQALWHQICRTMDPILHKMLDGPSGGYSRYTTCHYDAGVAVLPILAALRAEARAAAFAEAAQVVRVLESDITSDRVSLHSLCDMLCGRLEAAAARRPEPTHEVWRQT